MSPGRGGVILIMLVAVVALAAGETALSKGMKQLDRMQGGWADQAISVARNGWIAAGLVLLLGSPRALHAGAEERRSELCTAA